MTAVLIYMYIALVHAMLLPYSSIVSPRLCQSIEGFWRSWDYDYVFVHSSASVGVLDKRASSEGTVLVILDHGVRTADASGKFVHHIGHNAPPLLYRSLVVRGVSI